MSIAEQFNGLDMKKLIGGPLAAAADASVMLAKSTAEFINEVGFDSDRNARTATFKYTKKEPASDGNSFSVDMGIEVPLLAIVPIPNLQIDEVNIMFDMEVKQSEKSEKGVSASVTASASGGFGPVKFSVSGTVSAHSTNTRSTDNSAKYHVDVRATNHGTPEGLARALDILAASLVPNSLANRPTDDSGAELTGARRERTLKLKDLSDQRTRLEIAEKAASETMDIRINAFKRKLAGIRNGVRIELAKKANKDIDAGIVNDFWSDLETSAGQKAAQAASSEKKVSINDIFPPADGKYKNYTNVENAKDEFEAAVKACAEWENRLKAVEDNKVEYNKIMMEASAPERKG